MARRQLPDLDTTLAIIRERGVFLHYDHRHGVDIWAPGVRLPPGIRRSVVRHRQALLTLMQSGDVRACPARDLHRQYWRYTGQGYECEVCSKIVC